VRTREGEKVWVAYKMQNKYSEKRERESDLIVINGDVTSL